MCAIKKITTLQPKVKAMKMLLFMCDWNCSPSDWKLKLNNAKNFYVWPKTWCMHPQVNMMNFLLSSFYMAPTKLR